MRLLNIDEMKLASGGWTIPFRGMRMPFSSINRVPLIAVGVTASIAHQVGSVISGEYFSIRYLIGSTLASMATTPLLADAGVTHASLKGAVTMTYAAGFHGYVQGLVTQQPDADISDGAAGETA